MDRKLEVEATAHSGGAFAPLAEPTFRAIWSASLLSNFGQLILGVGAAWEMTRLASSPSMVALVQTAMMAPLMLVAVPAGAVADMYDRRLIAMIGLGFAMVCGAVLTSLAFLGLTTPVVLLAFCALIGAGVALYGPAWQASVSELAPPHQLPAAIALGSVSYNVARSFGPALGGLIVLALGAKAAFAINAIAYAPLLAAFALWKRRQAPSRLPPERIDRAIVSGGRYALHSPAIRKALIRAFVFGLTGASIAALAPLIARDILKGDAGVFGVLLGASGVGAVVGALLVGRLRDRFKTEPVMRFCGAIGGAAIVVAGFSTSFPLTAVMFFVAGAANILTIALLNVSVQMSAPRWVMARALSLFQAALTGGIGAGAWIWGSVAAGWSLETALLASGAALALTTLLGWVIPVREPSLTGFEEVEIGASPDIDLGVTLRSGPIAIEVDYDVDPARARDFYAAMLKVQGSRRRNGAFEWSISRDIGDKCLWTERYHCPTWGDYLRMRSRFTQADRDAQMQANSFNRGEGGPRVRRRLERPYGSVRWRADTPDPLQDDIYIAP